MPSTRIRRALLSVYDKTGLVDFARALHAEFGIELISTGGTARALQEAGIPVTLVEQITGFPEMLDGRVKTLHPRIHAAILADRDNPEHMRQLAQQGIAPIDLVVVNLYPFEQTIARPDCTFEQAIEMIDIGGPCLLRAAAKNHKHVLVLCDPQDWHNVLVWLRGNELSDEGWAKIRRDCADAVYELISRYDARVSEYLSQGAARAIHGRVEQLRYGENPHQSGFAGLLAGTPAPANGADGVPMKDWQPRPLTWADFGLSGGCDVEISFNNYLDASAAFELCAELTRRAMGATQATQATQGMRSAKLRFAPVSDELTTRRNLPHWQVAGATYWVTFSSRIGELTPDERTITLNALRFWDGKRLDLHAAVVMPDHVHALLTPRQVAGRPGHYENLSALLQSIKAFSGHEISQRRGGPGEAWVHESYDHWIRDEGELRQKWEYLANNIVKENLAKRPEEYPWWYSVDLFGLGGGAPPAPGTGPPVLDRVKHSELPQSKAELCSTGTGADRGAGGEQAAVCFIKHTNACGAALAADPVEAYRRAYLGDPNAAMGGILAVNFPVTADFAGVVLETYARFGKPLKDAGAAHAPGGFFVEVWLAPRFDQDAVKLIRGELEPTPALPDPPRKDWGKRVRLLAVGDLGAQPDAGELDFKRIAGGLLMQLRDLVGLNEEQWKVVTERQPTDAEMDDLRLAWLICKHTKSNAITICRDGMLLGNGAGQMSRVMSCRIASWLARENGHAEKLNGAVAASDAFFPFRDGPEILIDAGVRALIQPGGSKRDADTIAACNERGVAMVFTGTRHFKH